MYISDTEYKRILEKVPILCVDLLIVADKKCLLIKRKKEPAKGQFWFPGGRIFKLESIKDAAIRKAIQETGLHCKFDRIISIEESIFLKNQNMGTDIHTVNICCLLFPLNIDSLNLNENHNGFTWVSDPSEKYHQAVNNPIKLLKNLL